MRTFTENYPILTDVCVIVAGLNFLSAICLVVWLLACLLKMRREDAIVNEKNDWTGI